ncbi:MULTISPECIES: aminotransferase class V-fold PLP-dependent enzyme [Okeania]|uniref:Aminotransferase class V-fold PLP-dependent enzyme n=1 Tax=Okeania hirsuta TaxID=1458930 RepID=A0A3N6P6I8_9CYAN|nr:MULTISPECIES: aminotransferase class V-fold PLP-dependent enzyme [Okeania]NES74568.1 aminotransferase class V-fold PLP-dependent enzyme [Okeania sp. SIO1H4]NES89933.1 aminotransferase class V-fold PLP-dependent enzyme [Okeania sp. SIO2B9]NET18639.1 aminotransferase class V-fold PLP-dependent enzyme [Okeania sp. SIO1H5]NET74747.1 aminotransferase class V-fold PLP-dependent enzyme [Okeania sp. SIO1F9]NET92287.1 aminotransferase class V-fold PLP-dependent enzyme [Okeania sp. SIO1H2]
MNHHPSQLSNYQQNFPALANKIYFNYGGQGPMPEASLQAIYQSYQEIQNIGPFSGKAGIWVEKQVASVRRAIAAELGVSPDTITLTEDVTVGCNIPLWGIDWQAGDHILLSDCEHPGVIATIEEIQRRFKIEVSTCPIMATLNEGDPVEVIANNLRPNTKLLVISHILWNTGQVLPLTEIVKMCQSFSPFPVKVLVDAAQSVGVLPLKLAETEVDFYAFTGHKWWCGPGGLGGLYVSAEARKNLSPTFIGWRSVIKDKSGKPIAWQPNGKRYEIATSAYPLSPALKEAIALHNQWGTAEERYEKIKELSAYLWENLKKIPEINCLRTAPPEAGLVSFQLTNGKSHQQLVEYLEKQGMMVRTILDPDCVRACVHYFTQEAEIDKLVAEIKAFG